MKIARQTSAAPKNDYLTWDTMIALAAAEIDREPLLARTFEEAVLRHGSFEEAIAHQIALSLCNRCVEYPEVFGLAIEALSEEFEIADACLQDLQAVSERDPATASPLQPLMYYRGFKAVQCYRIAHWLWRNRRRSFAYWLQARVVHRFSIDIHPAAVIGKRVMLDHGTGIVIGETALVEDDVSMLHNVTLGGTGKEAGDRHPKIRRGVLIGAGAKVLGNIEIGEGARIAAGSIVLKPVPPRTTAVGVPARIVAHDATGWPAFEMRQDFQERAMPQPISS